MSEQEEMIIAAVRVVVEQNPDLFPKIVNACHEGTIAAHDKAMRRACDFETATLAALEMSKKGGRNRKGCLGLVETCATRWKGKTANAWPAFEQFFKLEASNEH